MDHARQYSQRQATIPNKYEVYWCCCYSVSNNMKKSNEYKQLLYGIFCCIPHISLCLPNLVQNGKRTNSKQFQIESKKFNKYDVLMFELFR